MHKRVKTGDNTENKPSINVNPEVDYSHVILPQDHIKAFCEDSNLPTLNSISASQAGEKLKSDFNQTESQTLKRKQSNPQVPPSSLPTYHKFNPFQSSLNSLLAKNPFQASEIDDRQNSQNIEQKSNSNQLLMNQLIFRLNSLSNSNENPFPDLLLHLKSKILLDLFHKAFKRYLQSVKPEIAKSFTIPDKTSIPIKQPDSMLIPRPPKVKRKNTDLMSSDTIEESDTFQHRFSFDKVNDTF